MTDQPPWFVRPLVLAAATVVLWLSAMTLAASAEPSVRMLPAKTSVGEVRRLALAIGNGAYRQVPALPNSVNDATAVAAKLQEVGFEVYFARDLDRRDMIDTIGGFLAKVEPGSEALVYYAGHGIELQGSNYLLPVDIPVLGSAQERLLRSEGTNLSDLLLELEARNARASVIIIDACRNNPFRVAGIARGIGATRGLGRVDAPKGTFVIYSAGVGEEAFDNLGPGDKDPNGVFTRKFLKLIGVEGLELRTMVRQLRAEVREAALTMAGSSQIPSYYDQLLGDFYFKPKPAAPQHTACETLVLPNPASNEILGADLEPAFKACERAVADYPLEPRFVHLLYDLQERRALQRALGSDRSGLSEAYLALFPTGRFVIEVRTHLTRLAAKAEAERLAAARQEAASRAETMRLESAKADAARAAAEAEIARAEAAKAEAAKAAAQVEAARKEVARAEAARRTAEAAAAKAESRKAEAEIAASQAEAAKAEAAKAQAALAAATSEAARAEAAGRAAQAEAAKADAAKEALSAAPLAAATHQAAATPTEAGNVAGASRQEPNATVSPASSVAIDPGDIARLLQIHLKRVGCDPGSADGDWNAGSRRALEAFNRYASTRLDVSVASLDALDAVRSRSGRVCPLTCARGYRIEGERCVQIACEAGFFLGVDGTCQKRKERPVKQVVKRERPEPRAPAPRAGARCFTFNGKRFCE